MIRTDVTFRSGSDACAAWWYLPERCTGEPGPIIVMAHGLGGVREMRLDAFAERFAAAGYACLVFDYRHFGASGGTPRQLLDIKRQRADWRAAVAFARTLDGVDPDRVVVWGTSFGGGHAIVTAAGDPRLAAAIAQCPFTDGPSSSLATPLGTSVKVTSRALADAVGSRLGRTPLMIPTSGQPGDTALMTAPDSAAGVEKITPADASVEKEVAARFALQIVRDIPGRHAKRVRCPILFAICEGDTVAPAGRTKKWAGQAPQGEIRLYDAGHSTSTGGRTSSATSPTSSSSWLGTCPWSDLPRHWSAHVSGGVVLLDLVGHRHHQPAEHEGADGDRERRRADRGPVARAGLVLGVVEVVGEGVPLPAAK